MNRDNYEKGAGFNMRMTRREKVCVCVAALVLLLSSVSIFLLGRHYRQTSGLSETHPWSVVLGQHQGTVGMSDTEAWGIILGVTTFVAFSVIFIGDQVLRLPCQRAIFRRKCQAHDGYCACYVR